MSFAELLFHRGLWSWVLAGTSEAVCGWGGRNGGLADCMQRICMYLLCSWACASVPLAHSPIGLYIENRVKDKIIKNLKTVWESIKPSVALLNMRPHRTAQPTCPGSRLYWCLGGSYLQGLCFPIVKLRQ